SPRWRVSLNRRRGDLRMRSSCSHPRASPMCGAAAGGFEFCASSRRADRRKAGVPLRPAHVFAGAGVVADLLAFLDEERDVDDLACLEGGRLLDVVRAVALPALG